MQEDDLKKLLEEQRKQAIDPLAKTRAINAALAEFNALHSAANPQQQSAEPASQKTQKKFQGFFNWLRLTSSSRTDNRSEDMFYANQKWVLGGIATACVAVFGVMVSLYNPVLKVPGEPFGASNTIELRKPETPAPAFSDDERRQVAEPAKEVYEEEVRVSGLKDQLQNSIEIKRDAGKVADAISAEDIGALPDTSLSESLQRAEGFAAPPATRAKRESDAIAQTRTQSLSVNSTDKLGKVLTSPARTDVIPPTGYHEEGRDRFEHFETNPIKLTAEEPVSTFSIDVDTASYSFVRRQLNSGVLPQKDAVRLEEMVNYFNYDYPVPDDKPVPFKPTLTVLPSPWHADKKLIHIGIKGYALQEQPKSNLVFLLDVSGSMNSPDKLPLVKQSMNLLLSKLRPDDTVAIAVYAGAAGAVLEPTKVAEKQKILNALNSLQAGGSTAGAQGIKLAYQLAENAFQKDAVNRIILATDGDFNVGITNREELKGFVERQRDKGIFLSVLGFGAGNYHDQLMQNLAQNGNGVAAYIDTLSEAQKVLVTEASSTLFPIAKDVKIQVEFNPATVSEYRLLGYETRKLNREDFNNDAVDAGEIGAGHSVTAIYEITPKGSGATLIDASRYAKTSSDTNNSNEYGFLKIRYKLPSETTSKLITQVIPTTQSGIEQKQLQEAEFAASVAGFAQLLKNGRYTGDWKYEDAINLAQANKGNDEYGYRTEFVQLIRKAMTASKM
ncbi:Ca-activated chloride channel family protein [Alteromonadaceae bacterium 2753L.S.0a.02]|nr:Ca-activated chloride channel family protein [Alteromonadaceae bacterium 2753L.S.0a.02]